MDGELVERGFLFSPIIPIYGFGAMVIINVLNSFKDNILLIFILGLILTSFLEYVTSYVMEKMFDLRLWDYTKQKYNVKGRICLRNSLMFGFLSVLLIQYIHPYISNIIKNINLHTLGTIVQLTFPILILDFFLSVKEVINFKKYIIEIDRLRTIVQNILSENNIRMSFNQFIGQREDFFDNLDSKYKHTHKKIKQLNQEYIKRRKRLLKRFPHITSKRFEKIIESIKEYNKK